MGRMNISGTLQHWAGEWGFQIEHIQSGKPQQNAYVPGHLHF